MTIAARPNRAAPNTERNKAGTHCASVKSEDEYIVCASDPRLWGRTLKLTAQEANR